jgi:tRNA nucleotidyltransferase (CCA-adding enzyme)
VKNIKIHENPEIEIPENLRPILQHIPGVHLIGGCVRDALLGLRPKDLDIEVHGMHQDILVSTLKNYGKVDLVGKAFGVYKVTTKDGQTHDFSLPRRDNKTGKGHRGFTVTPDPHMGIKEASRRRDFTINAMSVNVASGKLLDPFNGLKDLQAGVLRAIDRKTFAEDPLRVLRGFQFAARFGFRMDPDTASLCRSLFNEDEDLPKERIWEEWRKWGAKAVEPSAGLKTLAECGWLAHFKPLVGLDLIPQDPEWHPEGNVWEHTLHCVDALAKIPTWQEKPEEEKALIMLAVLCHDLGKRTTTTINKKTGRIQAIGHESAGVEPTIEFLQAIGAPRDYCRAVAKLVSSHMAHINIEDNWQLGHHRLREHTLKLAKHLGKGKSTIDNLLLVIESDHSGRPPLMPGLPEKARRIQREAEVRGVLNRPPHIPILGRDLMALGMKPGPHLGKILEKLENHFLEGDFTTKEEAVDYLKKNITSIYRECDLEVKPLMSLEEVAQHFNLPHQDIKKAWRESLRLQLLGQITTPEALLERIQKNLPQPELEPTP